MAQPQLEVVRDYTTTKRVPVLVGRFRDGMRLPGGPYTLLQLGVFAVLLLVLNGLRSLVGVGPVIVQLALVLALAWGGAWLAGRMPRTTRNIPALIVGYGQALFAPASGKTAGTTVALRKPRLAAATSRSAAATVRARLFDGRPGLPNAAAAPAPLELPSPALPALVGALEPSTPASDSSEPLALTGVERLRALARKDLR